VRKISIELRKILFKKKWERFMNLNNVSLIFFRWEIERERKIKLSNFGCQPTHACTNGSWIFLCVPFLKVSCHNIGTTYIKWSGSQTRTLTYRVTAKEMNLEESMLWSTRISLESYISWFWLLDQKFIIELNEIWWIHDVRSHYMWI
jgi:hypothetical protein